LAGPCSSLDTKLESGEDDYENGKLIAGIFVPVFYAPITGDYRYPVHQWVPHLTVLNKIAPHRMPIVSCNWCIGCQWIPVCANYITMQY
jgi:hypothetical protein